MCWKVASSAGTFQVHILWYTLVGIPIKIIEQKHAQVSLMQHVIPLRPADLSSSILETFFQGWNNPIQPTAIFIIMHFPITNWH